MIFLIPQKWQFQNESLETSRIPTYLFLDFDSVKRSRYHCQDLYKIQFESLQIVRLGIELFWLFEWNFDEFIKIIFKKNQNEKSPKTQFEKSR